MRYLLDEMYPGAVAEALRSRGLDVVGAQELRQLSGLTDPGLFAVAQIDRRTVVTENARDFLPAEAIWRRDRGPHAGLVLTSNRAFPRHDAAAFLRRFTTALARLDQELADTAGSFVVWLRPKGGHSESRSLRP